MALNMKMINHSVKVLYGYKDIFGVEAGRAGLVKRLETLPVWPVVDTISKLSVLLANVKGRELTGHIGQVFLRPDAKIKLKKRQVARQNGEFFFLSDKSLCLLLEFCRRHCAKEAPPGEINLEYIHLFGECLLISNDLASEASLPGNIVDPSLPLEERNKATRRNYATYSTREFLFNASDQFRYTLARSRLVYDLLKGQVAPEFQFDLSAHLETSLGFSLEDYFMALLAINSYWANQSLQWEQNFTCIDPDIVFPKSPRTEKLKKVLTHLSQEFNVTKPIPTEREAFHEFQYKHYDLRSRPLLNVDGRLYCASLKFAKDLFWQGPYFLVLNNFPDADKKRFLNYLGHAIENYVVALIKNCMGNKVTFPKTSKGHPIGECVVEMRKNWKVIIEVKGGRADSALQSMAVDPADSKKVDQMLYDGLSQMSDRISEMRADGYTGQITPLLITGGNFPINSVVWDHYLEKCKNLAVFTEYGVDFPQVMDVEAIETLCAYVTAGARFGELLLSKLKPKWLKEDMTIFFIEEWVPKLKGDPPHPILLALNSKLYNDLVKALGLSTDTFDVEEDWRAVFNLGIPTN